MLYVKQMPTALDCAACTLLTSGDRFGALSTNVRLHLQHSWCPHGSM